MVVVLRVVVVVVKAVLVVVTLACARPLILAG